MVKSAKPLALYEHQEQVETAHATGQYDRYFLAWHRRAGKDVFGLEFARKRMEERTGTYWHLFPFHVQAKRAIWKGIDARDGLRFIDRAFPEDERENTNETEMSIDWKGSHWQMLGSDNYDRMVGSNPCGILFSEWALCDPAAWDYIRPILIENNGWAMFITTFRGRNHAYRMYEGMKGLERCYVDMRTIQDTYKRNGSPIVSLADVERARKEGMSESLIQQEFYCNPDAATSGAIFNKQYIRLLSDANHDYKRDSRVIRIAWGINAETIAAIAFQGTQIIAVHTFAEWNITDAIQAVSRRHAHAPLIHHAKNADPTLFGDVDGAGYVDSKVSSDDTVVHGLVAAMLNTCSATAVARERLCDFAMAHAPYRELADEVDSSNFSIANALAVMKSAQGVYRSRQPARPLVYASDRGVI